jgi:hypothetical protein
MPEGDTLPVYDEVEIGDAEPVDADVTHVVDVDDLPPDPLADQ